MGRFTWSIASSTGRAATQVHSLLHSCSRLPCFVLGNHDDLVTGLGLASGMRSIPRGFKQIAKVDTGLSYEPDFDANVDRCAMLFSLYPVLLRGNTSVIQKSYLRAKKGVCRKGAIS